jgi:hypothetical protein
VVFAGIKLKGLEMPNRLLKEGIVDSEKINSLSPEVEVFFYRLLVVADDFGRMDGRSTILRARCFPLKDYTNSDIEVFLLQLETAKLVFTYKINDMLYIQINNWSQRQRSHGKYPPPTVEQMTVNCQTDDRLGLGWVGLGKGMGKGLGEEPVDKSTKEKPKDPEAASKLIKAFTESKTIGKQL